MQIHRKQIAWRNLVLSFLTAAFVLGPSWNNPASSEVINIGWTGEYWSTLPFRVAADKGFFEREGLQARLITMRTSLITPALMQGDLDYTVALPSIAGAALHGVPAKILGVVSKGTGYAIVSKPEIESVQGLKGRKFGINSFGASDDYTVYTFLSKSGLDPTRDVTFLSIGGTSARFAALTAGVVDAAAVSSPFEYIFFFFSFFFLFTLSLSFFSLISFSLFLLSFFSLSFSSFPLPPLSSSSLSLSFFYFPLSSSVSSPLLPSVSALHGWPTLPLLSTCALPSRSGIPRALRHLLD